MSSLLMILTFVYWPTTDPRLIWLLLGNNSKYVMTLNLPDQQHSVSQKKTVNLVKLSDWCKVSRIRLCGSSGFLRRSVIAKSDPFSQILSLKKSNMLWSSVSCPQLWELQAVHKLHGRCPEYIYNKNHYLCLGVKSCLDSE